MEDTTLQFFLQAYENHSDAIFRYCLTRTYDKPLAEDLVQDTFKRTWEYLAKGKQIDNPKTFLYRIARNLIIDHSRKAKAVSLDGLMEEGFDTHGQEHLHIQGRLQLREVMAAAEQLDEKYREVFLLRHIDDMSVQDIAKTTGESENAISVRIHRASQQLKKILNHESR